jgi:hypothetical protein
MRAIMEQLSVFDRLSHELSSEDRQRMLASIRSSLEGKAAPIIAEEGEKPLSVEDQLKVLGLWRRIVLFISHLFRSRDEEEMVRQWMLRDLEQEVSRRGGAALDGRRRLFLEPFAADLRGLRLSAHTISPLLRTVTTGRSELVIALAMELFPAVHAELLRRTDGDYITSLKDPNERTLRRTLLGQLEEAITNVPPDARSAMRRALSQADTLSGLASVGYEGMVTSFEKGESGEIRCAFDYLDRSLTELYRRLLELQDPIDLVLLEILVLLDPGRAKATVGEKVPGAGTGSVAGPESIDEALGEAEIAPTGEAAAPSTGEAGAPTGAADAAAPGDAVAPPTRSDPSGGASTPAAEGLAESVRAGVTSILDALARFREFARRYPLLDILRLLRDDPWWSLEVAPAGEDWIGLYRAFFTDRIHRQVLHVSLNGKLTQRLGELREVCQGPITTIAGLPNGENGVRSTHRFLGVAVRSLATAIYPDARHSLRVILTSGEFYKSSNRAQFNDAYEAFERLPSMVTSLEHDLQPDQAWGAALSGHNDPLKRREVGLRVDRELQTVAEFARTTVDVLVNTVGGILYARPGSSYDTLANYGQIGGRRNAEFIDELKELHQRLSAYVTILGEIESIEGRAAENSVTLVGDGTDLSPGEGESAATSG